MNFPSDIPGLGYNVSLFGQTEFSSRQYAMIVLAFLSERGES